MKYKADWAEAQARLKTLWEGRFIERPCIAITAPNGRSGNPQKPISGEQKWLDAEFVIPDILNRVETTYYGGEAIPSY